MFDIRHSIDDGFVYFSSRIEPIIAAELSPHLNGRPWVSILSELDLAAGRKPNHYSPTDPLSQINVLTYRLGDHGYPFDDDSRLVSALGNELRMVRNRLAHHEDLTLEDAWRTHDFVLRLLEYFGDSEGAQRARSMRDEALAVYQQQQIADEPPKQPVDWQAPVVQAISQEESVSPDDDILLKPNFTETPTIGPRRLEFDPWVHGTIEDLSIFDGFRNKDLRSRVRSMAQDIVQFEGPVYIDRLSKLIASSFGVERLSTGRRRAIENQIRQAELDEDNEKFFWPDDIDRWTWREFRPNGSTGSRDLSVISPVEIANAMRAIMDQQPGLTGEEVDWEVLRIFGRKKSTKGVKDHLAKARAHLD